VRDAALVRERIAAVRPDVVIHTAYMQDGPDAWSVNVDGAATVAAAAREHGARLIHVSTDVVFSGAAGRPLTENDEPDPVTDYGRSKAAGEHAVREAHPDTLIVRTSLLYGGPEPSRQERMALDPDASFYTDELRCPVEAGDLAAALLELAELGETPGVLHVAGADSLSRHEFAQLVVAHHGGDPASVRGAPRPPDRPGDCRLDSSRAQALLRTRLRGAREVLGSAFFG
jgi:dTDP-4-dehydrorhamnose reductase